MGKLGYHVYGMEHCKFNIRKYNNSCLVDFKQAVINQLGDLITDCN